jgi:hypothetical protein
MTVTMFQATKGDTKQSTFQSLATRFTLPAKHVAFNSFGSAIAAGGE